MVWHRRRQAVATLTSIAVLASLSLLTAGRVNAAPGVSSPRDQQQEVRKKKAEAAAQVDALRASDAEVTQALSDLSSNVASAQAEMNDAQRAVDDASSRADQFDAQASDTQARIDDLRKQVAAASVEAFMRPPGDQVMAVLEQDSARDATTKQALLDATNGSKLDVVDQFRGAQQDLEVQRDEAARARDEAQQRKDALSGKVDGLRTAQAQQQLVAVQVNQRIDAKLAEADSLATLDKQLSGQIAAEQAALVTKVQKVSVTGPPPTTGGGSGGGGGGGSVSGGLTTVRGITVASSIAGQLSSMLSAADAAGLSLGGGGYRDSAAQIALRKAHCGTSDYAIYQMPSSQCHPPTAPPGSSMHEQGLAIDFTNGGRLIQSRGDSAFQWLAANAGSFGFRNLPSEPWHWSVNGN